MMVNPSATRSVSLIFCVGSQKQCDPVNMVLANSPSGTDVCVSENLTVLILGEC